MDTRLSNFWASDHNVINRDSNIVDFNPLKLLLSNITKPLTSVSDWRRWRPGQPEGPQPGWQYYGMRGYNKIGRTMNRWWCNLQAGRLQASASVIYKLPVWGRDVKFLRRQGHGRSCQCVGQLRVSTDTLLQMQDAMNVTCTTHKVTFYSYKKDESL